jgi:transposase
MAKQRQPPGPPMTLGDMRELGVRNLIAFCLNDACRHQALINVDAYPADTEVPWFARKVVCNKCGARGRHIDVRPIGKSNRRGRPCCAIMTEAVLMLRSRNLHEWKTQDLSRVGEPFILVHHKRLQLF